MNRLFFFIFIFFVAIPVMGFDTCSTLHGWVGIRPGNQEEYKRQYDSLRHYIESCGKNDDSYDAFPALSAAAQMYAPNDTTRYDRFRDWLISVLYLNTTQPYYFCSCVESIAGTYLYGQYHIPNAGLAVINYLRSISACDDSGLEQLFRDDTAYRHRKWLEGDRTKPEDTTLPPLDKIGLGFLLQQGVPVQNQPLGSVYLASFTLSPNPFTKETALEIELNRMAYIVLTVYDDLGKVVWGNEKGTSLEAGRHTISLDGASLPRGTLYARISTGFGEVKTLKLVRQ